MYDIRSTNADNHAGGNKRRGPQNKPEPMKKRAPMLASLGELVGKIQEQIGTLSSRVESVEKHNIPAHNFNINLERTHQIAKAISPGHSSDIQVSEGESSPRQRLARQTSSRRRYCGPTSPDYSLNVAQIRMKQGSFSHQSRRPRLPSIEDSQSDDGGSDDGSGYDFHDGSSSQDPDRSLKTLIGFTRHLTKCQATQLMSTYQEVFGDFHPILDIRNLVSQLERLYQLNAHTYTADLSMNSGFGELIDESSVLIINLVLSIALCAEPTQHPSVDVSREIYSYCRQNIETRLISSVPHVNNAVIAILVGTYQFFRDDARTAWRMCGTAGNILLELGLHSRDVPEHILGSERERVQVIAVICTTIVLDRQWSAATGLPTHFQESHFHQAMKSSVESPYLRAMVAFMALSDKFTSPVARCAATGQPYDEDETFDILNFQIEQWRKNSVGSFDLRQHEVFVMTPIRRIPSWAVLLNLRANAAHSMLLRPFFFTNKPTPGSRKNIESALRLSAESINILSKLDKATDVYRKQQPFYVHLLVSACALMSLVIAHVAQNHSTLAPDLPENFSDTVSKSFRKALKLAKAYNGASRASRKLWKRLLLMREPLMQLKIVCDDEERPMRVPKRGANPNGSSWAAKLGSMQTKGVTQSAQRLQDPFCLTTLTTEPRVAEGGLTNNDITIEGNDTGSLYPPFSNDFMQDLPFLPGSVDAANPGFDGTLASPAAVFGGPGSTFCDWPLMDSQTFFSEGELLYEE
ncbi:fungal specific transcription factor domain-containing protein [Colletotrichum camelliae]|nr:fungal specific transcription factor domain-containing protein [Colletotrichum camelliae]